MSALASSRVTSVQPPEYGVRGTTTGPGELAGAAWMCAAVIGSTPSTWIVQHTRPCPGLMRSSAVPLPSGSPWFGTPCALTSFAPVRSSGKGRPPVAADPGAAQMSSSPTDATGRPAMRRPDDIATPKETSRTISPYCSFQHHRLASDSLHFGGVPAALRNLQVLPPDLRPTQLALPRPSGRYRKHDHQAAGHQGSDEGHDARRCAHTACPRRCASGTASSGPVRTARALASAPVSSRLTRSCGLPVGCVGVAGRREPPGDHREASRSPCGCGGTGG